MAEIIVDEKKEKEKNEEKMRENIMTFQILQQRLEEMKEQSSMLEKALMEMTAAEGAISDMKKIKKESDILIPLGGGSYASGTIKKGKILVDIGAGIMINKTAESAIKTIAKRKTDAENALTNLQDNMQQIVNKMTEISQEIEKNK